MTPPLPELILLKGAPGVGKSTAARLLASQFASGVRIEVDDLRKMVVAVRWTDQAEHRNVLLLSAQLAAGFLRSGFAPVILVDMFSGDKIDLFLARFRADCPQARPFVAALHATTAVLRDRVLNREEGGFRDLEISMRLNEEVASDLRPFERLIETSALSPAEVAELIVAAAQSVEE